MEYEAGTLTIEKAGQTITWNQNLTKALAAGEEVDLTAKASSGLSVEYTSSDNEVAVVERRGSRMILRAVAEGEATLVATQQGDKNHFAAEAVRKTIRVKGSTGLPSAEMGITIWSKPGEIIIDGARDETSLAVYDLQGRTVYTGQEKTIEVRGGELYFVKIDGRSYKVFVL